MEKLKIFEMFAGYGTTSFALKRLNIPFELVGYSEIDKYASKVFEANHGGKNYGDCRLINPNDLPDFDLLTAGFPCQAFSIAGKMNGELDPRGTLFYEIIRIAENKKPRYMLLENVKGLMSKRFKPTLLKILSELSRIGYHVIFKVLNSKDYGVPHNRERVFFACFRESDDFCAFDFPLEEELKITLKDILEKEVDNKYLWSEKKIKGVINSMFRSRKPEDVNKICHSLRVGGDAKGIYDYITNKKQPVIFDVYHFLFGQVRPTTTFVPENNQVHRCLQAGLPKEVLYNEGNFRSLTPKECFRLQGFLNDEININMVSDTQAYKLAGNGQTVNVVAKIFENMLKPKHLNTSDTLI
jgi:DNA (cytosine-5)-methyltransferase 1